MIYKDKYSNINCRCINLQNWAVSHSGPDKFHRPKSQQRHSCQLFFFPILYRCSKTLSRVQCSKINLRKLHI